MNLDPAIIRIYDEDRRTVRVEIIGRTDGAEVLPEAVFSMPIGDAYDFTEIEIHDGDPVWVDYIGGDPRKPIVVGYRTMQTGNANGWRRFRHANIKLIAAEVMELIAGQKIKLNVGGTTVTLVDGEATIDATHTHVTGSMTVDKLLTFNGGMAGKAGAGGGNAVQVEGKAAFTGDVTAAGKSVSQHTHPEHDGGDTGKPN